MDSGIFACVKSLPAFAPAAFSNKSPAQWSSLELKQQRRRAIRHDSDDDTGRDNTERDRREGLLNAHLQHGRDERARPRAGARQRNGHKMNRPQKRARRTVSDF